MTREQVEAIFLLSGIKLYSAMPFPNGYSSIFREPWWQCTTDIAPITIGWRKRVISIDWSQETKLRSIVTKHDVTKEPTMVHAYSYADAVSYLAELRRIAQINEWRRTPEMTGDAPAIAALGEPGQ